MNKKTGLADSPFFRHSPPPLSEAKISVVQPIEVGHHSKAQSDNFAKRRISENAERRNSETANSRKRENETTRPKIRQGIDVFKDQIMTLNEMQMDIYKRTGSKPRIGGMIRTAVDEFIARKQQELEGQS